VSRWFGGGRICGAGGRSRGGDEEMATWSEYDERTGEYHEGSVGEACCARCGMPIIARFEGDEIYGQSLCNHCRETRAGR